MTQATFNVDSATGHQVLAAAGKTVLRPGGKAATEQLLTWANFQPGETVLELASSFGYSAIALAQRFGVRVLGVEKNPESVTRARINIALAGLADQVKVIEGDIFHLEAISEQFDYVFAEAILSMQSPVGKAKLLASIRDRLKPNGKFLSHELLAKNRETEIHQALAKVIRSNTTPLSEAHWLEACEQAGLKVEHSQTGAMQLLNLQTILNDEGVLRTAQIFWNLLTQPLIRERVLAMRRVFNEYQADLGHIILCAIASDQTR